MLVRLHRYGLEFLLPLTSLALLCGTMALEHAILDKVYDAHLIKRLDHAELLAIAAEVLRKIARVVVVVHGALLLTDVEAVNIHLVASLQSKKKAEGEGRERMGECRNAGTSECAHHVHANAHGQQ